MAVIRTVVDWSTARAILKINATVGMRRPRSIWAPWASVSRAICVAALNCRTTVPNTTASSVSWVVVPVGLHFDAH